jgi:hypothetical protein
VDVMQSWLLVGVPGVIAAAGLFVGRNQLRAWIGYGVLAATVAFFAIVPSDPISVAALSAIAVVYVATGRGTHVDADYREHHQDRKRFTTADQAS